MATGRISVTDIDDPGAPPLIGEHAQIILGPDVVTYLPNEDVDGQGPWVTRPLSALRWIEWDEYPFDPPDQLNEIDFLRQFIGNLSVDEIEAGVEAMIGVEGMHRNGEWIKAAILRMIPG